MWDTLVNLLCQQRCGSLATWWIDWEGIIINAHFEEKAPTVTIISILLNHMFFPFQQHEWISHCYYKWSSSGNGSDEHWWIWDTLGRVFCFPITICGLRSTDKQSSELLTCEWGSTQQITCTVVHEVVSTDLGSGTLAIFELISLEVASSLLCYGQ